MNYILTDLCKEMGITIPQGALFLNHDYFYKAFGDNVITALWNGKESNSYVIGLIVNGVELKYPFETEEFKKALK
jgi:hypothetical protein